MQLMLVFVICNKSNFKQLMIGLIINLSLLKINNKIVDKGNLWAMPGGASESIYWLKKN